MNDTNLIADIYKAALEQGQWTGLLDRLCLPLGARGSALLNVDVSGTYDYQVTFGNSLYPPETMKAYENEYASHEEDHFRRVAQSPLHEIQYDSDFEHARAGKIHRPDIEYLKNHCGVYERFAVKLTDDASWFDCLTFQYSEERKNVSSEEASRLLPYLPHIAETVVLSRSFAQLQARFGAALQVLDRISNGLLLVTRSSQIILANQTAEILLNSSDGIRRLRDGRLEVTDSKLQPLLGKAIEMACSTIEANGDFAHQILAIPRRSNKESYLVEISPLSDSTDELNTRFQGAIVTIIDPHREDPIELQGFTKVYGLTKTESSVVKLYIDGMTYNSIAECRGVSNETIKSQLKSIFAKTRSKNRAELIRRALRVTLPIKW